jgi:hypothetical protein
MKAYLYKIFLFSFFILLFACKKEKNIVPVKMEYDYYPLLKGRWIIYDVYQIYYNDFTHQKEISEYQIKEEIDMSFKDNSGEEAFIINRYKRDSLNNNWNFIKTYFSNLTKTTAESVEDNFRYIKLVFPVLDNKTWNTNAKNLNNSQIYKYTLIDKPYKINNLDFKQTLTILQADDSTAISKDYATEVYALDIGMIYKRYVHLEKEISGIITKGIDYTYIISSYGN